MLIKTLRHAAGVLGTFFLLLPVTQAQSAASRPDGAKLYEQRCAACHEHPRGRVPSREALGYRASSNIVMALKTGAMQPQATGLTTEDARAIAAFLTADAARHSPALQPNPCPTAKSAFELSAAGWNGWGMDLANSRFQPHPGLAAESVRRLKLKWAFAFPGLMTWGQPTVMGGRVFVTSTNGQVYALDASTGCTLWHIEAGAPVRTAISVGLGPDGKAIAYFGDTSATVHAVDAATGTPLWSVRVDDHPLARVTGAPILFSRRLLVPVSSYEEGAAGAADYGCCTFRGSIASLDASTGRIIWKRSTIAEERKTYRRKNGDTDLSGPAGASVWDTPTVDLRRGVLYVGTGNDYTDLHSSTSDSVLAIGLASGEILWKQQLDEHDSWASGCAYGGPCPEPAGLDADFAASVILVTLPSGRDVLIAGQKSGTVYALDPAAGGKVLWRKKVGAGGVFGGIEWGMAAMGGKVFVPISDSLPNSSEAARPGLAALDAATGEQLWWSPAPRPTCVWGAQDCRAALSQAVTAMPGIIFAGSQDGHLRAYEAESGRIVWDLDTGRDVPAVNTPSAHGGSLDGGGPVLAGGLLYVNSGYGQFLGRGGNVLLVLSEDGK
jgi:polyvinyl alcohol dehydrogenase (cytochrome)